MVQFIYTLDAYSYSNGDISHMLNMKLIGDGFSVVINVNDENNNILNVFLEKNEGTSKIILDKWIYNIQNNIEFEKEKYKNKSFEFIINSTFLEFDEAILKLEKFKGSIINFLNDLKQFSCNLE